MKKRTSNPKGIHALATQYDEFSKRYLKEHHHHNAWSRSVYYSMFLGEVHKKKLLDVACGDGYDLEQFRTIGIICYGLDASSEMIKVAKKRAPQAKLVRGLMEDMPFPDEYFDIVVSKYALQTTDHLEKVIQEMSRVLKPGGTLAYLVANPLRQFMEKKKHPKDYFVQETVESVFFQGKVTAREPTHTINEYLNPLFLEDFTITHFREETDFPSCEKVEGDTYPCFFVLKATKKI